jgi:hypothetical protein
MDAAAGAIVDTGTAGAAIAGMATTGTRTTAQASTRIGDPRLHFHLAAGATRADIGAGADIASMAVTASTVVVASIEEAVVGRG